MGKKIIFATSNQGKMREIREILKDCNCEISSLKDDLIFMMLSLFAL